MEMYHTCFCFRLLNCISNLTNSNNSKDLWPFLESVYNSKLPIKRLDLKINSDSGEEVIYLLCILSNNLKIFSYYIFL